jgi:hypothetical protein
LNTGKPRRSGIRLDAGGRDGEGELVGPCLVGVAQFIARCLTVGEPLAHLDEFPTDLGNEQVPDAPAAGTGKEPQLPLAGFAGVSQKLEHLGRFGAGVPFGFRHGLHPPCGLERTVLSPQQLRK